MKRTEVLLVFAVAVGAGRGLAQERPAASLGVRVLNLHSDRGRVGCTLFDTPDGFPMHPEKALQRRWCPIAGNTATCGFDPVPAGTYAVACFHDENANGKLDTKLFGIPKEGTVVSNRARGHMGPPKFQDAEFRFDGRPSLLVLPIEY